MIQSFDLLDLTIVLTPPPENAPADALASMTVCCDALGLNHTAGLLTDPLTPPERADLRWYLEEYSQWPYAEFAVRGKRIEAQLSEIGKRLYQTAFGAVMGQVQPWRLLPTKQRQISIVSTVPAALSLPWELLHDEQGFLVLRTRQPVALLRRLEQHELSELPMDFTPPLRVLVVTARPSGTGFLDPRSLPRELLDAVQPQIDAGAIEVEFLRPPTRAALRQRLAQTKKPVHLLHFDGHGVFAGVIDPHDTLHKLGGGQGMLAFEDAEGKLDLVPAEDLAQLLQDSGVKLAVLDACQSAMSSADDAFSSVAARLIQGGVDATVAMSASVLVVTSTRFFARFYRELAAGTPAPIAQERARQDLYDNPRRHLFRRHLDEEGQPVELRDWWLPHYYQQRPLTLRATRAPRQRKTPLTTAPARFNDAMLPEPHYRFSGRAWELLQIERHLLHKRLVVLSGFGGVGKTALAREAADWLTRTGLYTSACFISFEHGGDASLLLSTLGTFLSIQDGNYTPSDPDAALTRLTPVLQACPTLVIADNLESLLPGGEAPLELEFREQLWHVLRELTRLRAGVLLTTRDPTLGDDLQVLNAHVAALPLRGLAPDDAYALATQLLERLSIQRDRVPYAALRDLLTQLDHHPLALQLVLPALQTFPLTTIRADFALLLQRFTDDHETGRNRSLLASLDYSLRRLSDAQRSLLLHLAPFEGGGSEFCLLKITKIPEAEWKKLRMDLVQAGLLTLDPIPDWPMPFLRFHPVLVPFLRSQQGTNDVALHKRFAEIYATLVHEFRYIDHQNPLLVRIQVQRELPNLRQALAFLLETSNLNTTSLLIEDITYFLNLFGRWHERDTLQQRLAAFLAAQQTTTELGTFTVIEYSQEMNLGEAEWKRKDLSAAIARFTRLLACIEAQPTGTYLSPGSYQHCNTLMLLACCLTDSGQPAAAEQHLRQALLFIEVLIEQETEDSAPIHMRSVVLANLADALRYQGQYTQARELYEKAMEIAKQMGDRRQQAVVLGQLGTLALVQFDYEDARLSYSAAMNIFQELGEPEEVATAWHNLGNVASRQEDWTEAERCYRETFPIHEQTNNAVAIAITCIQLANVVQDAGRPVESERWYRQGLARIERTNPGGTVHALALTSLAQLLVREVQEGRAPNGRLAEAKRYAEQAWAIEETFDISQNTWDTLNILAEVAEGEGQAEVARTYRRRSRETFAAFEGNRSFVDYHLEEPITLIANAALGDAQAREAVEAELPQFEEESSLTIAAATRRLWAGERDWRVLAEEMDNLSAFFILRVLETITDLEEAHGR